MADSEWIRLYGEDKYELAVQATEWVLRLPFPPGDDPLAQQAASGEPAEWPAQEPANAVDDFAHARRLWSLRETPAIPRTMTEARERGAASSSGQRVFALAKSGSAAARSKTEAPRPQERSAPAFPMPQRPVPR